MSKPLRMTNQRTVIINELRNSHNHPTAEQVYHMVIKKLPNVSLSTVHRNLEKLSDMGMIQRYESAGRTKHFDPVIEPHDHIYCQQCPRIDNLMLEPGQAPTLPQEHDSGYQITGCHYYGVCPECQK